MYSHDAALDRIRTVSRDLSLLTDLSRPTLRRYVDRDGLPHATHGGNAKLAAVLSRLYLTPGTERYGSVEAGRLALSALGTQNEAAAATGLIDLPSTNWQSAPDTAFTLQLLAPVATLADRHAELPLASDIATAIRQYAARTVPAIIAGGFHTPNHRWVIASALAVAQTIEPATRVPTVTEYVNALLAEGIDINPDGEYSERSTGAYAAVSNRALILLADHLSRPELLDHVRASLRFLEHLLHDDWSIVTAMSTRQDRGRPVVPEVLVDQFLIMGHRDSNRSWIRAADGIFDTAARARDAGEGYSGDSGSAWLLYPFELHPELAERAATTPAATDRDDAGGDGDAGDSDRDRDRDGAYRITFPASGVHRIRDGALSATVLRHEHDLLDLRWGAIHLTSARLAGAYFGNARFMGTEMEQIENGVVLRMPEAAAFHPAYYLPVDHDVPAEAALTANATRPRIEVPPFALEVRATAVPGSPALRLRISSSGGRDGVPFELALCFAAPLRLEADGMSVTPLEGATIVQKGGSTTLRAGAYALRVTGGSTAHRTLSLRGAIHDCGGIRLVLPLMAPLDDTVVIEGGRWSEHEDRFVGEVL